MIIDYHKLAQQLEDTLDPLDEDEYYWAVEIKPGQSVYFTLSATTREPVGSKGRVFTKMEIHLELLEDPVPSGVYYLRDSIRKAMDEELKFLKEVDE